MSKKNKKKYVPGTERPGRPVIGVVALDDRNDRYSTYPSNRLNPKKLAAIFREADEGDVFRQMELLEEMEGKDTHLFSQLQTRKLAVTGLDWEVQAFSPEPADKQIKDWVEEQLKALDGFTDNMMDLLDAIGKGISFLEIEWGTRNGQTVIESMDYVHQKKFFWDENDELRIRTDEFPGGIPLPENKFVIHKYKARSGHPSKAGVLRVCAWMYLFKNYDIKDWVSFCEVYGMPLRLGTYSATATKEEKDALRQALVDMGSDAAGIIPDGTNIKFIESNKQSSVDIYEKLARFCDEQMSKAIVGQTLTSDSGGSYAQGKVHNDVRQDLTEADCKSLMETIRRDVIRPLVLYNFGPFAHVPYFKISASDTDDLKEMADIYKTLADSGLEISKSFLYRKFNIPAPEGNEAVIGGAKEAPAMPMPYQMKQLKDGSGADEKGQRILDQLTAKATGYSTDLFQQMFQPILKMVDNCESLEALQKALQDEKTVSKLYASMDLKNFQKLMEKVMYVSNMIGRVEDG